MKLSTLKFKVLHRRGERNGEQVARHESFSCDFHIDDTSLLEVLVQRTGGHSDFLGCFARGWDRLNKASWTALMVGSEMTKGSERAHLYVCPECGDIACGAYCATVSWTDGQYMWHDFTYENGYEEPLILGDVGPFLFEAASYGKTISQAASL